MKDLIVRTPLVKLNHEEAPAKIYLKLETLQPIGSFKIRGACNAMRSANPGALQNGVWTMSGGNHGQGVAYSAKQMGLKCTVFMPNSMAKTKLEAMERMGAEVRLVNFKNITDQNLAFKTFLDPQTYKDMKGYLIHPFNDTKVMVGQGTIGLEIIEDIPDVDTVVIQYGGGGLACGIASALHALKPDVKIYGGQPETGTSLAESFREGKAVEVNYETSFVESAGSGFLFPEMWDLAKRLLDGGLTASLEGTASAIRLMADRNKVIAEGAGAISVAASLAGDAGSGKVVCIVSGASIDTEKLIKILQGKTP